MKRRVVLGILAVTIAFCGHAFVGQVNDAGQFRRWALNPPDTRVPVTSVNRGTGAIIFHLDGAGWSATNAAAELDAVRCAFDQWQAIPGTRLMFQEGSLLNGTRDTQSQDGTNSLFWATSLFVNGGRSSLSGVLALTLVASYADGNVILDADTAFNGVQFRWFTDADVTTGSLAFVEAIALHEIGHALGLRHSPSGGATMLAVGDFGVNSQVGLSADELAAARALYGAPGATPTPGGLRGTVQMNGAGILGAAVFAHDAEGTLVSATVTRSTGGYDLPGLPPGRYSVRAAPLDPTSSSAYLVRGIDIASEYSAARTDFLPSADLLVEVLGGTTVTLNITVSQGDPLRIARVLRPAADLSSPSYNNKPVSVVPAGQTVYLGALTSEAADPAMTLQISGNGLTIGSVEVRANALGSLTLVAAPVQVDSAAAIGLRTVGIGRGDRRGWAHGFLEILPPFPDLNADGLDDRFQRRYWTRFTVPDASPDRDPDGDGFNNAWEFSTDTHPRDPASVKFAILSVRVTADGARVRAQTAAGRPFQLLSRETVPGSDWVNVGNPVTAASGETEFLDPGASGSVRFYQVRLLQ